MAEAGAGKRTWTGVLLRVVGLALIVLVIYSVGWRDSIQLAGSEATVAGEIVGEVPDWDAGDARLRFRPADGGTELELERAELAEVPLGDARVPVVNEGLVRIVRRSDKMLLALGFLMFGVFCHFGVLRWWWLLRDQGIHISFWQAHRLTFLGMFFNNVAPGATGGDVVKAVYIARHTEKRAAAVVTVLIDRVTGIIALAMIAAFVLVFNLEEPKYRALAVVVFGFLGATAAGAALFFSTRVRRLLRFDSIKDRLPMSGLIHQVDEAAFVYRYQKAGLVRAFALSFLNQYAIQFIAIVFGAALHVTLRDGGEVTVADYFVALPVGLMASAIPLMPGGWGLRETAFAAVFYFIGVDRNPAVALSVMIGFNMLLWSLLGGVYFLQRRGDESVSGAAPGLSGDEQDAAPRD